MTMFNKNRIKDLLPHFIAVIIFVFLSFLYFYPVLEGKVLKANDSQVSKINSKEIQDFRDTNHREPLWTNSIFGGMPAFLISTQYPGNLIKKVDLFLRLFKMPVSVLFLSMVGFYLMLLIFGVNPWLSVTGSLAYGFSSFFFLILAAGHNTQAIALAYMAPMIGAIYYTYKHDLIKGLLFTSFILALELVANHPQITYYAFICLLVFGITELVFSFRNKTLPKFFKTSALLIIPFIIAVGINFAGLYTVSEYGKYSMRGKSDLTFENQKTEAGLDRKYITNWSYGINETLNLLIPNYKGGSSRPFDRNSETFKVLGQRNAQAEAAQFQKYWGTQPGTDGPHYVGAIVFFLFILGIIVIKGPEKWWLVSATVLSVMLAWGRNFMPLTDLFIDYFPGYNKFRAVTMTLVIAQFCMPLLGILALRDIFNGTVSRKNAMKALGIAGGITGGIIILILLIPGIAGSFLSQYELQLPDWLKDALVADRKALLRNDGIRSLLFIVVSAGVIAAFIRNRIKTEHATVLLALLIILDLWIVDKRYLNADRFERESIIKKTFLPSVADADILKDGSYYRVLNFTTSIFNDNSPTSYFHKSIGGYHGAKLQRYQEFVDSVLIGNLNLIQTASANSESFEDFQKVFRVTHALNMLNTKYIIYNPEAPPMVNNNAMGNAWFVQKPIMVQNANEEISTIKKTDVSVDAVIDNVFKEQIKKESYPIAAGDTIELVSYQPDELVYKYSASDEKLVVFSEIYYPAGWICTLDGKESEYFRADYILRGMVIPAGTHEIRFSFKPASYIVGNKISLASSILLILLLAGFFVYKFKFERKTE